MYDTTVQVPGPVWPAVSQHFAQRMPQRFRERNSQRSMPRNPRRGAFVRLVDRPMSVANDGLTHRLRQAAERTAELAREASIKKGVRTFVRLNLEQVAALYEVAGSWDAVSALLAEEGLHWRSGKPVTGHQLRSLYASLRKKHSKTSLQPLNRSEPAPQARGERAPTSARPRLSRIPASTSAISAGRRRGLADLVD